MSIRTLVFTALLLSGCVTEAQRAQVTLTTTARALVAVDDATAPRYERAAAHARQQSSSWVEYDVAMADWNHVEQAERAAQHALLAAQAGLSAWQNGLQAEWLRTVPCLVQAVDQLLISLQTLNIEIQPLHEAVAILGPYVGTCEDTHE